MAEAGGIIGCLLLVGCCGACFACGRGCKSDSSTEVREPQQQPVRIVVAPVAVSPAVIQHTTTTPTEASVPSGYLVMTDPVTGQQQLYAPVAPLTPTAPTVPEITPTNTNVQAEATEQPSATDAANAKQDELKAPLLHG